MGRGYIRFNFLSLIICAYGTYNSFFRGRRGGEREYEWETKWIARSGLSCNFLEYFSVRGSTTELPYSQKISNALASSLGDKITSHMGKMVLGPNSSHPGLKAGLGHGGDTQPRSSISLIYTITTLPQHRDSVLITYPSSYSGEQSLEHCRSPWTFVE